MLLTGEEANLEAKVKVEANHLVTFATASIVENPITGEIVPLLAKGAKSGKDNHFKAVCKVLKNVMLANIDLKRAKARDFTKSVIRKMRSWMTWQTRFSPYFTMTFT